MKTKYIILPLLCLSAAMAAQEVKHHHEQDSTDVFFRHLQLNELTVTGVTGETKLKHATAPVSVITPQVLRATSSTNIIDAISHQPGVSQLTTGGSISKPIIRGLGYNRVVVMSEGVRQEGQQWGDEHGVEVDGSSVGSVEILKGPASLMYGSDAMAGVVILHAQPTLAEGEMRANVSSEYQTNNGLFAYHLSMAGNQQGFVWDARYGEKMAHAYKNKYDGYVPGSQFSERSGRLMLGVNKNWGSISPVSKICESKHSSAFLGCSKVFRVKHSPLKQSFFTQCKPCVFPFKRFLLWVKSNSSHCFNHSCKISPFI